MSLLRNISLFWAMAHTLVLCMMLFESRYPKKKTIVITLSTMIPLMSGNLFLCIVLDANIMGMALLLTLSLPSLIVFWILAKKRDGRFYFTFCLIGTVVLELIFVTQILNYYISPNTYIVMFVVRLLALPIMEWFTYKKLRPIFLAVQKYANHGWGIFAAIGALFYVLLTLVVSYPSNITTRPEYLPAAILLFILIPVIYLHIIVTLRRQQNIHEITEQENILRLQVNNMTSRIEELAAADEKFRMERHNYRHKMKTIASLVELGQYEDLALLVREYNEAYQRTQTIRYSNNAVIDAVLSTYIKSAENNAIRVELGLAFPNPIPVNETELATVLANAIENAINACEKLEENKRFITIKVICKPQFMIMIRNSFDGHVEFDEQGIPVNHAEDHGFGTRSIATFCNKNNAHYIFKAEDKTFSLYLMF